MNNKELTSNIENLEGKEKMTAIFKWHNAIAIQKALNTVPGYENHRLMEETVLKGGFSYRDENGDQVDLSEDGDIESTNENLPGIFELAAKLKILKTREMIEEL